MVAVASPEPRRRLRGRRFLLAAFGMLLGLPTVAQAHPFGAPPIAELRADSGTVRLTWMAARDDLAALAGHLGVSGTAQEFAVRPDGTTERLAGSDEVDALAGRPELEAYVGGHLALDPCVLERVDVTHPTEGLVVVWRCPAVSTVRLRSSMLTDVHPSYRTLVRATGLSPSTAALTRAAPVADFALAGAGSDLGQEQSSVPRPGGIEARVVDAATTVRWSALLLAVLAGLLHGLRPGHGKSVTAGHLLAAGAKARASWGVALAVAVTHSATAAGLAVAVWLAGDAAGSTRTLTERAQLIAGTVALLAGLVLVARFHRQGRHDHGGHEHHGHPRGWSTAVSATVAGLVPSPTAFVACATALYAGKPVWGVLLVLAFGLGLALGVAGLSGFVVAGAEALTRRAGAQFVPRARRVAQGAGAWLALSAGAVLLGSTLVARG